MGQVIYKILIINNLLVHKCLVFWWKLSGLIEYWNGAEAVAHKPVHPQLLNIIKFVNRLRVLRYS